MALIKNVTVKTFKTRTIQTSSLLFPVYLPLSREDTVEQSVSSVAALWWREGEHILENIEGKLFLKLTEQSGFGKGRPFLLQSPHSTNIIL